MEKKSSSLHPPPQNGTIGSPRRSRRLSRTLSAAALASLLMAGGATAADSPTLNVNGSNYTPTGDPNPVPTRYERHDVVNVTNNGWINPGTGPYGDAYEVVTAFNASDGVSYNRIFGTADFNKITADSFWISGTFDLTGDININEGRLRFDETAQYTSSNTINIAAGAYLLIETEANHNFVLSATNVNGSGTLRLSHEGTVEIASALDEVAFHIVGTDNSVTRLTSASGVNDQLRTAIFSGTLVTAADDQLGRRLLQIGQNPAPAYAALDLAGTEQIVGGFHLSNNAFVNDTVGGGRLLSIYDSQIVSGTLNVEFAGDVKLTKTGTINDEVMLNAISTYTGETRVLGGALRLGVGVGNAIASSSGLYVSTEGDVYNSLVPAANEGAEFDVNGNAISVAGLIELDNGGLLNDSLGGGSLAGVADVDGYAFHLRDGVVNVSLTGNSGLRKDSTGTVDLNVTNYYLGATSVNEGLLNLFAHHVLPTVTDLSVAFGARVNFNGTSQKVASLDIDGFIDLGAAVFSEYGTLEVGYLGADSRLSGAIIGHGLLVKVGGGTLVVDGVIDITDRTRIVEGDLHLVANNGRNITGSVTVGPYGALTGNGHIGGNVLNQGVVSPGNSPGTIVIDGDYTQPLGGSYLVEIDAHQAHDQLLVGGTAYLGGDLVVTKDAGYRLYRNDRFNILQAGSRDGQFDHLFHNFGDTMLAFGVDYKPDAVWVVVNQRKFADLKGLTHNQRQVAKGLDHAASRNQLDRVFDTLNYTHVSNVPGLLSELSPEQLSSIFSISVATSQIQNVNIERRLDDVRNGSSGFSANGLALRSENGASHAGAVASDSTDGLTLAGWDGKSIVSKEMVAPVISQSRWGFFATGHGEWANIKSTGNAAGQEFTSAGFTLGADYRVSENFVVGLQGGYTNTQADLLRGGSLDVDGGRGGVYASVFGGGAYLNAAVGGGYNSYRSKRQTLGGRASGDSDGGEFNALLGLGYDHQIGGFSIGPVASVQYTYTGLNDFTETGSVAPLHYASQHADSLRSLVGLKLAGAIDAGSVVIRPEVRAQWKHEYMDSTPGITSRFVGADRYFTVDSPDIGRDSLVLDAGAAVDFNNNWSAFAYYTGELGRKNYDSHSVNGGFRVSF
ncbi:MAG TPA: autotransporter domain-containing protein [Chthoniobacteraceae bacterium]|nr:autotransporter domain-containing protein [Chthoniobacteraceae bacterium]